MSSMWKKTAGAALLLTLLSGCHRQIVTQTTVSTSGPIRVVFIPKNSGNPYFDAVNTGFKKASGQLGFKYTQLAPATAEATNQIPIIQQQIQNGVNAIAISPNSTDALAPVLKQAMQKGVTVITVDADMTGSESSRNACVLPTDFSQVGSSQIELMGSLMGYQGKFAILSATTDAPNQNFWIAGMKQALKNPKYSKMTLVGIVYGNDDPQKSLLEAQSLLTRYPDLKGILAPTSVGLAAAAQAVESARDAGRVQVTGLGTPNQMRRYVTDGTVKEFALWDPSAMGDLAGTLAYLMAKKSVQPAPGVHFQVPSGGSYQFGPNNVLSTGPLLTFSKSNIGSYHF